MLTWTCTLHGTIEDAILLGPAAYCPHIECELPITPNHSHSPNPELEYLRSPEPSSTRPRKRATPKPRRRGRNAAIIARTLLANRAALKRDLILDQCAQLGLSRHAAAAALRACVRLSLVLRLSLGWYVHSEVQSGTIRLREEELTKSRFRLGRARSSRSRAERKRLREAVQRSRPGSN